MEIKSIKNVDKKTWRNFKMLAEKNNMKMSVLLKLMVNDFEKNSINLWDEILNKKGNLSEKDARVIEGIVKSIRQERGFRNELSF